MNLQFWLIVIVSLITIGVVVYLMLYRDMDPAELFVVFVLGVIFYMTITFKTESEPKPIDVYRGKTSLKILYIDSIPQDTLVIWKEHKQ